LVQQLEDQFRTEEWTFPMIFKRRPKNWREPNTSKS
jgi:hypothetical protein